MKITCFEKIKLSETKKKEKKTKDLVKKEQRAQAALQKQLEKEKQTNGKVKLIRKEGKKKRK